MKQIYKTLSFIYNHPFNKNNKLESLIRFLNWQLISSFKKSKHIFNWVDNTKFYLQKGEVGMTGNLYCGLVEYIEMSFILHCLNETDHFYDIGSNVGSYTLLASGVKKCQTTTFEPIPSTFSKLKENIILNKIENLVDSRNIGIGDENKKINFTNNLNSTNRVNIDNQNKNITEVDVCTLDTNFEIQNSTVVKIDVEGFESQVLDGGKNFFSSPNLLALIVELNGSGKINKIDDVSIHKKILSFGFIPISYDPFSRKLKRLNNFNIEGNTIYIKNLNKIQDRCFSSKSYCIHTANKLMI